MKLSTRLGICVISLSLWLAGCREVTLLDRSYQRLYIDNFSTPLQSRLPARQKYPNSMTLWVTGTVDRAVTLSVYYLEAGKPTYPVLRDSLNAGTYVDHQLSQDFYSRDEVELQVTGAPGTTGSLNIEWYCQ